MGAQGGFISVHPLGMNCLPVGCTKTIRSAYGGWSLDTTSFFGTVLTAGMPANAANGGYLVKYISFNELELAGDYLYRQRIGSNAELNRMNGTLNIGGNVLGGVDNIQLTNDVNVVRNVIAQGGAAIGGNLTVTNDLIVNGDARVDSIGVGNNLIVESRLSGTSLSTNNMTAKDAGIYDLTTPQVQGNNIVTSTLDATGSTQGIFAVGMQADDLTIRELLNAGVVESDTLNTGNLGTGNMDIDGSFNVDGSLNTRRLSTQTTRIMNLIDCEFGC